MSSVSVAPNAPMKSPRLAVEPRPFGFCLRRCDGCDVSCKPSQCRTSGKPVELVIEKGLGSKVVDDTGPPNHFSYNLPQKSGSVAFSTAFHLSQSSLAQPLRIAFSFQRQKPSRFQNRNSIHFLPSPSMDDTGNRNPLFLQSEVLA